MKINQIRTALYFAAKALGDVQAVASPRKGAVAKRLGRRIVGKVTGRALGKLFR